MWWTATRLTTPGWTEISSSSLVTVGETETRLARPGRTVAVGSQEQLVLIFQTERAMTVEIIILPNTVAEIYRRWTKTRLWLTWHEY